MKRLLIAVVFLASLFTVTPAFAGSATVTPSDDPAYVGQMIFFHVTGAKPDSLVHLVCNAPSTVDVTYTADSQWLLDAAVPCTAYLLNRKGQPIASTTFTVLQP